MSIQVKICGLSTTSGLDAAVECGADFAGFVFYPRSPRNVTIAQAATLADRVGGRLKTVALVVDAEDSDLKSIARSVAPSYFQLHGNETIERVAEIKRLVARPIIKAIKVRSPDDIEKSCVFERVADIVLFDAFSVPDGNALPGGNGLSFDWTWLRDANVRRNFMLSGGLNATNVQRAIEQSGATSVDVSSGVETAPGVKSAELIGRFVTAAKRSKQETGTLSGL